MRRGMQVRASTPQLLQARRVPFAAHSRLPATALRSRAPPGLDADFFPTPLSLQDGCKGNTAPLTAAATAPAIWPATAAIPPAAQDPFHWPAATPSATGAAGAAGAAATPAPPSANPFNWPPTAATDGVNAAVGAAPAAPSWPAHSPVGSAAPVGTHTIPAVGTAPPASVPSNIFGELTVS